MSRLVPQSLQVCHSELTRVEKALGAAGHARLFCPVELAALDSAGDTLCEASIGELVDAYRKARGGATVSWLSCRGVYPAVGRISKLMGARGGKKGNGCYVGPEAKLSPA